MKVTVKTTQQKVFTVDIEPAESIGDLKAKILDQQGHAVASQKIIYSGKILADDKTIESCGIKEKDFLVLMVSKPKPTPAPAPPPASASAPAPAPVAAAAETSPAQQPPSTSSEPTATTQSQSQSSAPDPSGILTGSSLETAIANLVEMGFERPQVIQAMRASFNNADRAAEYLMTGIPPHLLAETGPPPAAPATQSTAPAAPSAQTTAPQSTPAPASTPQNLFQLAQQQQSRGTGGGGGSGGIGAGLGGQAAAAGPGGAGGAPDLSQIQNLRERLASNPAMMQAVIQQLAASNPQLAQLAQSNPEALLQLMAGAEGEGGPQVIQVSPEEAAAIERLEGLGFSREAAAEAYFACDKDEELAANYLFSNAFED